MDTIGTVTWTFINVVRPSRILLAPREWKWKQIGGRNLRLPGNEWAGQRKYDKSSMMCHRESLLPNYIRYPIKSLLNKVYCNSSVTVGRSDHQSLATLRVVVEMNSWENEVGKFRLPGNEWMGHLISVLDQILVVPRGCPTEKMTSQTITHL